METLFAMDTRDNSSSLICAVYLQAVKDYIRLKTIKARTGRLDGENQMDFETAETTIYDPLYLSILKLPPMEKMRNRLQIIEKRYRRALKNCPCVKFNELLLKV